VIEPVTRQILEEVLEARFNAYKDLDKEIHKNIHTLLQKHEDALHGDNGLKDRVTVIETTQSNMKKLIGVVTAVGGVIMTFIGFKGST